MATAETRRAFARVLAIAALACCAGIIMAGSPAAAATPPATFLVGADAEDITPPNTMIAGGQFHLGGYGFGTVMGDRHATGVMGGADGVLGHVFVRAFAVSDGKRTIAFADLDNQGAMSRYRPPSLTAPTEPGIDDIRAEVSRQTGGKLAFDDITISSDHSHAGQDLTGVWGLVPQAYFDLVKAQAVKAFVTAYERRQPAYIKEGAVPVPRCDAKDAILNNQFCGDPGPADIMDYELRTLQAVAPSTGKVIVTVANFAAHATVMGGGNTLLSPDWPGVAARYMEQAYGGVGIVLVADVGRSQPARTDCNAQQMANPAAYHLDIDRSSAGAAAESCKLSLYARRVMAYVDRAVAAETPLCNGGVDGREAFIHEAVTQNAGILALDSTVGDLATAPVARANTPPYLTGLILGTWVGTYRVGDLVITTNPGEAYPPVRTQFITAVPGARHYWTLGLANDQLGYLTSPLDPTAQEQVIVHFVNGNDNFLFNSSIALGDHIMCTQVAEAVAMGMTGTPPAECVVLTALDATPYLGPAAVDRGAAPTYGAGAPLRGAGTCTQAVETVTAPSTLPDTTAPVQAVLLVLVSAGAIAGALVALGRSGASTR